MDWLLPIRPVDDSGGSYEVVPHSTTLGAYGSFLMACAVRAAAATVEGMVLTSLRADFLKPPPEGPIGYQVESTRSGRSVAVRRVVVGNETPYAIMTLSFATERTDLVDWEPEAVLIDETPESLDRFEETAAGIELLHIRPVHALGEGYGRRHPFWARPARPFGGGSVAAAAAMVIASDYFVTALATPGSEGPPRRSVTLDHSVWVHRETEADEWLRYDASLVVAPAGRAVMRGEVVDRAGRLVASFVQQALRVG